MKKYTLSDSDMFGINESIDKSNSASDVIFHAVIGTWNAILAQEGTFFSEYTNTHGRLNPTDFGIPHDQAMEIGERMTRRLTALNISPIGITNALLDWANVGPSNYEPIGAHPAIVDADDLVTFDDAESDIVELNDFPYVVHKPHNND